MSLSVGTERDAQPAPRAGFEVRTLRCDATCANVRVSGHLDADGALVLAQVIDGHLRAGRRFLRLHIGAVRSMTDDAR